MNEEKFQLARLLGQIYRVQRHLGMPTPGPAAIYGLTRGIETAVDEEFRKEEWISADKVEALGNILDPIFCDEEKLAKFKGYYDIEAKVQAAGIDRGEAIAILRYLHADRRFTNVIEKMDSSNSPAECRTFELDEFD